jgi:competence protein ComEA
MKILWMKYKLLISAVLIIAVIILWMFYQHQSTTKNTVEIQKSNQLVSKQDSDPTPSENASDKTVEQDNGASMDLVIDIKGAVRNPGIYHVHSSDRVIDGIALAGGLTKKADRNKINLAQKVADEMVIYVPVKGDKNVGEIAGQGGITGTSQGQSGPEQKVNVNTADEQGMQNLPGIGPAKAKAIIQYREEHGPFKSLDELTNVSGIGDKSLEKIKPAASLQ